MNCRNSCDGGVRVWKENNEVHMGCCPYCADGYNLVNKEDKR
jgi:hypothetical protein